MVHSALSRSIGRTTLPARCFIKGAGMVQRRQRERSLSEVLLPDGHKLWPDWLRRIDTALEDEAVIDVVAQALEKRWPQSRRRGRLGTPADVVIRMLILKHLFDWSYDHLQHEVRANLVYRGFTRIDAGDVPDANTILKIARAWGPEVIGQLHRQVVEVAKRAGVTHGRRFRIDTTVVETNVHYPTDSTLLQDGVRALTRAMHRGCATLGVPPSRIRNRLRSVARRCLAIRLESRREEQRPALVRSYRRRPMPFWPRTPGALPRWMRARWCGAWASTCAPPRRRPRHACSEFNGGFGNSDRSWSASWTKRVPAFSVATSMSATKCSVCL